MVELFDRSESTTLFVSVLAAVEVRSAIRRRQSLGDIDQDNSELAIATLIQETGRIIEHPLTATVVAEANTMIDRHQLRALDSIQIATAIVAREAIRDPRQILFVASDHKLLQAAAAEGFTIWDPASERDPPSQ